MMAMKCETAVLQNPTEFDEFIKLLVSENVRSYLEIGSKHGGSFWRIANALPVGSKVVSVDLPHGDGSFKESDASLRQCVDALETLGYDAHLIIGDSTNPETINLAWAYAPFDACFIDACHDLKHVTSDWHNYGMMANIVAFHDISWWRPPDWIRDHGKMDVPDFWNVLKTGFTHKEIQHEQRNNGIGVLWHTGGEKNERNERQQSGPAGTRAVS